MRVHDARQLSARDAFFLSLRANLSVLRRTLEEQPSEEGARAIVRATIAAHDGDVFAAERILERGLDAVADDDAASYVADLLVPMLISRLDSKRARALLSRTPSAPDMRAARSALLAVIEAQAGNDHSSLRAYRDAEQNLVAVHDDVLRGKIIGRGALASFYLERYDEAVGRANRAADLCVRGGAARSAVHHYSLLVSVYRDRFADTESSLAYAQLQTQTAMIAGDQSLVAVSLSVQIELAAGLGDARSLASLRRRLHRIPTAARFRQRMSVAVGDILRLAWSRDFTSVAARSAALREGDCTAVERTLLEAFLSLAAYARGIREESLRWSSAVVASRTDASAAEQHFLRIARIIVAHVEIASGRGYAGRRLLDSSALRRVMEERFASLVASETLSEEDAPTGVRGYVRALVNADAAASRHEPPAVLTPGELAVLPFLAEGLSAKMIAAELCARPSTVRTQIYSISKKLGTHGAVASIAEARFSRTMNGSVRPVHHHVPKGSSPVEGHFAGQQQEIPLKR